MRPFVKVKLQLVVAVWLLLINSEGRYIGVVTSRGWEGEGVGRAALQSWRIMYHHALCAPRVYTGKYQKNSLRFLKQLYTGDAYTVWSSMIP